MFMLHKRLLLFFALLSCSLLHAQDANYWTNHYSTGGFFLPGAVVANNGDSGVFFYNPALLTQSRLVTLSASATAYQYDNIKIKDGAGTGKDLVSTSTGATALMLVGSLKVPGKHPWYIGYGLIQQPAFNFSVTQRRDDVINVLDDSYSPGPETFIGQYLNQNSSKESGGVIGAGLNVSKKLSLGITIEGYHRTQLINNTYYARALVNEGANSSLQIVSYDASYYAKYNTNGLRFKLGAAWDGEKDKLGLLISSPNIGVNGKGTILTDNVINNMDFDLSGNPASLLANTRQENLKATWKKPFSIAAGYSHFFQKWTTYVSLEYFGAVKEYNILTPRKEFFIRPDTGFNSLTPDLLKLKDVRQQVLNWSAGASYVINAKYTLFLSLRSDYTYANSKLYKDTDGNTANTSQWNIYHFQTGLNIKQQKFNLRVGGYLSYGKTGSYPQEVNFDDPKETNFLTGTAGSTSAKYFSAGLLVAYLHNF